MDKIEFVLRRIREHEVMHPKKKAASALGQRVEYVMEKAVDGLLFCNGKLLCGTSENALHALPEGRYLLKTYALFHPSVLNPSVLNALKSNALKSDFCKSDPCKFDPCKSDFCREESIGTERLMGTQREHLMGTQRLSQVNVLYDDEVHQKRKASFFRIGNGVFGFRKGIIVGTPLVPGCVTHSRQAYDSLCRYLAEGLREQLPMTLQVEDLFDHRCSAFSQCSVSLQR